MRECLRERRLHWFGILERMEKNAIEYLRLVIVSPDEDLGRHGMS